MLPVIFLKSSLKSSDLSVVCIVSGFPPGTRLEEQDLRFI